MDEAYVDYVQDDSGAGIINDPMDRADERKTYFYAHGLVRRIDDKDGVWYAYE